jgi:hypothetical protein
MQREDKTIGKPAAGRRTGRRFASLAALLPALAIAVLFCGQAAAEGFVAFQSYNYRDHYVRHRNYLGEITTVNSGLDVADSSFRVVPGLAGGKSVSFESRNYPGHYLRHQGFRIKLHRPDGSDLFRKDASFWIVPGLADPTWYSFESVNYPGHYLRHRNFHLYLEKGEGGLFRQDCTFREVARDGGKTTGAAVAPPPAPAGGFVSLQSYNYRNFYVRHRNYLGEITAVNSGLDVADSSFRMVPGLAGGNTVSFESRNYPGHYLRHQGFRIKLHRPDGSDLFRKDASFRVVPGLADPSWKSFESVNYPGYHLRHRNFQLFIEQGSGDLYRQDCTFREVER